MRLTEQLPAAPRRPGARPSFYPWDQPARRHPAACLAGWLIGAGWRWRVELAAALVTLTVWKSLAAVTSRPAAAVLVAALLVSALASARLRGRLGWIARRARLRRRWGRACRHAGLETFNERTPRITRMTTVPVGEVLRVRLPAGQCHRGGGPRRDARRLFADPRGAGLPRS